MKNISLLCIIVFCCSPYIFAQRGTDCNENYFRGSGPVEQQNEFPQFSWTGQMGDDGLLHWADSPVWKLNENGCDDVADINSVKDEIEDAFATWSSESTIEITFSNPGTGFSSNEMDPDDNECVIFFANDSQHELFQLFGHRDFIAATILSYDANEEFYDVDIGFNDFDEDFNIGSTVDIQTVALHEIGHLLGLSHHLSNSAATMYWGYSGGYDHTLHQDDIVGASFLCGGNIIEDEFFTGLEDDTPDDPPNCVPTTQVTDYYFNWPIKINSGAELEFSTPYQEYNVHIKNSITVQNGGTLNVNGTSAEPVTFTRSGASGNWDYVKFNSGSSGTISNANIEYAKKGIYCLSDAVTIEDCIIEDFTEQGIYAYYSDMTIEDCIIRNPDGASHGMYLYYSNPTITGTAVYGISGIGVYDYFGNTGTFTDGRIEDCTTGLQTFYSSIEVYNNYFEDNTYGVRFATNSDYVDIHNNDFILNDYGIYVEQSEPNEVRWNQFGYSGTWNGNEYAGILAIFSYGSGNTYLDEKNNNFYDGDLYGKDIINNSGTILNAEGNYWENEWTTGTASVDTDPDATENTNAGPGGSLEKTSGQDIALTMPAQFALEQNYPNPFNPGTVITFHLPQNAKVNLVIYDVLGRTVRSLAANAFYQPGIHQLNWDGRNDAGNTLASGVYFYRLKAVPVSGGNSYSQSRKLVFIQ